MTRTLLLALALIVTTFAKAKETDDSLQVLMDQITKMDSIEKTLNYQTGKIELNGGIASINVPAGFKFLGSLQAKYVIEDLWGNPPSSEMPLGLLLPVNSTAWASSYAFVVSFDEIGYVKDGDADKIDYADLMVDMKKSSVEENVQRKQLDLATMDLVGWASQPYYDKEKKVLHWAKEYNVEGVDENTLNYDIRVLGRKGVLTLQAVAGMTELDSVKNHINDVLAMVSFNDGHRYSDFDSKTDEVAAWTIGGLVAGKVLAKAGFFAVILKFLKFILIGLALVGGAIWKFITGRRKKEEEYVYQPQPAPDNNPTLPQP